jgi:uncharacterized protein YndB with AHSA1/START domain
MKKKIITVMTEIEAPLNSVWQLWTSPEHITKWCHASDDWHAPYAENDLRKNGKFKTTMAAKDSSASFDFEGIYTRIQKHKIIEYMISDGRRVEISFSAQGSATKVLESFEAENIHPSEKQKAGWQAILDNFKNYTETIVQLRKI